MSATTTGGNTQAATTTTADPNLLDQIVSRMTEVVSRAPQQVQPMELRSFDELERWAERAARSSMVPKDYQAKPDNIILAVQMGSELGLRPMQSLQNIAVVNGRPSIWGDAMLALCMMHPLYAGVDERIEGEGDNRAGVCVAKRKGDAVKSAAFSVADAKRAGLWGKGGPWTQYPDRMLQLRARGFALRDAFPDKLRGLISAEEAGDYDAISAAPPATIAFTPEPPREPTPLEKAEAWADDMVAKLEAARTYEAVNAIVGHPGLAKGMERLEAIGAKSAYDRLEAARTSAMERAIADSAMPTVTTTEND